MTLSAILRPEKTMLCTVHCKKKQTSIELPALSQAFSKQNNPSILGGNSAKKDGDKFSYWAAKPTEIFEFKKNEHEPFEKLQKILTKYQLNINCENPLPKNAFKGGWIGYFSYELGRYIEKLPKTTTDDMDMPLIRLCFYDRFLCYDHIEKQFWLVALELPGDTENPQQKFSTLELIIDKVEKINVTATPKADLEKINISAVNCNMDKDYYFRSVEKIKKYIYDGQVYQVNFSQRFNADFEADPIDLFHWQNHYNPSSYSAYLDMGDTQIVSASPEMYIILQDRSISTKPIKGTRPYLDETRDPNAKKINAKNFHDLATSEKERAELNMIIDLERNDMARICQPGTRKIVQPRTIETYPTVYHAVATLNGKLKKELDFCDILKGMFPGGSITGAPKISSMEIIDETEPTERGVYTGSIGFIGIDQNAVLNIAIRTIIIKNKKAYAQTGGGIVADSDAQAEWDETLTKARALLAGIDAVQNKKE